MKKSGLGFADILDDYQNITLQEAYDKGVNKSFMHVDFMIGTRETAVDGIREDGEVIPVFRNGNFVISGGLVL